MKNYLFNMFANIKNGQLSSRNFVLQNKKYICKNFLDILWEKNWIIGYTLNKKELNTLKIFLKYINGQPAINNIKIISKPSNRVYYSSNQIWKINSNKFYIIFSTNQGLKSIAECKKLNIGGEPIIILK